MEKLQKSITGKLFNLKWIQEATEEYHGKMLGFNIKQKSLKRKKDIISKIPLKRTGKPEDIAKAVKFLIEDGQYITGQNINIDGGRKLNM